MATASTREKRMKGNSSKPFQWNAIVMNLIPAKGRASLRGDDGASAGAVSQPFGR
jgi:hypothetical protein